MRFAIAAVLAVAAAASSVAKPMDDVHATSLDLYAVNALEDGGRFAISVSREDDLVEKGDVVAARFADIIMMFDVTPKGEVTVNDKVVPMGLTNIEIEAGTVTGVTAAGANFSREDLEDAFDVGVVSVQVLAVSERVEVDGEEVNRITIAERVFELNGNAVVQGDVDETVLGQVIDVYANGTMVRQRACAMMIAQNLMPSPYAARRTCVGRFERWFNTLPTQQKAVVVGVLGCAMLTFYAVLASLAIHLARARRADALAQEEPFVFVDLTVEGKKSKVSYDAPPAEDEEALPAYGQGYNAVPTSEPRI
ncbi:hypothetical protein HDU96_005295 [Phlyctochytrium bullatum]|nr:hypothetical protein HDU96_005295 [Phlyctochytrium bullatum]